MINIKPTPEQHRRLQEQLWLLTLSAQERKRLHRWMNRQVLKHSRARIRRQSDLDGLAFKARKDRSNRKMLQRLLKRSHVKAMAWSSEGVVTWSNRLVGAIARGHQEGFKERITRKQWTKKRR